MTQHPRSRPDRPPRDRRNVASAIVGVTIVVVVVVVGLLLALDGLLVDRMWFESVGQLAVWDLRTFTRLLVWIPLSSIVFLLLTVSIWLAIGSAGEAAPRVTRVRPVRRGWDPRMGPGDARPEEVARDLLYGLDDATRDVSPRALGLVLTAVALVVALVIGLSASADWQTLLLWQHQQAGAVGAAAATAGPGAATPISGYVDPVFGRSASFYLFDLPFYRVVVDLAGGVLDALVVVTGVAYLVLARRSMTMPHGRVWLWHLGILVGLRIAIGAVGFQLDKYGLVTQQRAYPYPSGVGATDAAVRIPAADLLTLLTIVAAVVVVAAIVRHRFMWAAGAFAAWFVVAAGAVVLAGVNQALIVNPNPLDQERRFIGNDIAATRLAYGLDAWTTRSYPATDVLTQDAIVREADTFANARLWDYRPLGATLDQLQTVRQYYDFTDVDVDRYPLDGKQRQVMLSGREMALDRNPSVNNWLNAHFVYTHGFGVAMVPVNAVQPDGLPDLIVKDMPVESVPGAPVVTTPQIYFGERPSPWIVTGALTDEFDHPASDLGSDETTRWTGSTGIRIGSGINRLLLSIWTGDFVSMLTTPQITSDSQFLMRRSIAERLGALAPFLSFDSDPYLVVTASGKLMWIVDGYTTSDQFPMARAVTGSFDQLGGPAVAQFDYVRNSVKAVIDAYDGTTHLYVNDPSDPLIATWQSIYPSLFSPLAAMPAELVPHLRYPEGLFDAQTGMFEAYHVTDPTTFYQGDNLWTVPSGAQSQTQSLPSEAYYVQMRLPDASSTEYLLIQPMVPARRPNMIAWVAARNDGQTRGQVLVYQLPTNVSIFGPTQIEARIDQTPEISAQISLWDQSGSSVIRGNLIVVPVGGSFVYLQPIYLQSTSSAFPQFTRIVVATPSNVAWAATLAEALQRAVGQGTPVEPSPGPNVPAPTPTPGATPGGTAVPGDGSMPGDVDGLIGYANEHFKLAQQAIGAGDYETYGREMAKVQAALERLSQLTSGG